MRKQIITGILASLIQISLFGQNYYLPLHRDILLYTHPLQDSIHGFHSSVKPYLEAEIRMDSGLNFSINSRHKTASLIDDEFLRLIAKPLLYGMFGAGTGHISRTGAGADICIQAGNYFSLDVKYLLSNEHFTGQYSALLDSGYIPHYGKLISISGDNVYTYQDLTAYLSWSPYRFLNLELGKDRNFWGEGFRSLFLSDNSNSYPFFKTTFTAWKIKYVSLLTFLKDVNLPGNANRLYPKFSALHYLSWNANSRLNISFYESVTFKGNDTADFTAFDFQYINPFIFYRPVEFSVGSPGKMHLGLGYSLIFYEDYKLYGQFLLGEFVLKQFLGGKGWWGNKYAIQLGIQSPDAFRINGFHLLIEGNLVRPYTYSHSNTLTNFGYEMQPLAHPLGANFIEGIIEARYLTKRNVFSLLLIHSITGLDSANINFGQNIYNNYTTRPSDYSVWLLQGQKSRLTAFNLSYSYLVLPKWNLIMEAGINGSYKRISSHGQIENYIYLSLKTLLNNDEPFKY